MGGGTGTRGILSGGSIGTHLQMGIGDGVIPSILNQKIYDDICIITDDEAIDTARALASQEGIMCEFPAAQMWRRLLGWPKCLGRERLW